MSGRPSRVCSERELMARCLAQREDDSITRADQRWLVSHLESCSGCRAEALERDPSLVLLLNGASSVSPRPGTQSVSSDADRVVGEVLAAIEVERTRRRLAPPRQRLVLRAASVALLAGALLGLLWSGGERSSWPGSGVTGAPTSVPAPAAGLSLATMPAIDRPVIEGVGNPGATIYQFAATSPKAPMVVFIVDKNADI